jgi:hypothetical protein
VSQDMSTLLCWRGLSHLESGDFENDAALSPGSTSGSGRLSHASIKDAIVEHTSLILHCASFIPSTTSAQSFRNWLGRTCKRPRCSKHNSLFASETSLPGVLRLLHSAEQVYTRRF